MRPIHAAYFALLCFFACLITAPAQAQAPPAYQGTSGTFSGTSYVLQLTNATQPGIWSISGTDANGTAISTNQADWNVTGASGTGAGGVGSITVTVPLGKYVFSYLSFCSRQINKTGQDPYYNGIFEKVSFQVFPTPDARPAYGMPAFSWQGTVAGVNTGNGNKTTTLPIVGWTMRGGMPVSCALIHNSHGDNHVVWGPSGRPPIFLT